MPNANATTAELETAKVAWLDACGRVIRARDLHWSAAEIAACQARADEAERHYCKLLGLNPDTKKVEPPKMRQKDTFMPLTTHSPEAVAAALTKARAELDLEVARETERQIAAANLFLRGSKDGDAGTIAAQLREHHLRNVVGGLEKLAAENSYADVRRAIDAREAARAEARETGARDETYGDRELYAKQHDFEARVPGIAERYETAKMQGASK